MEPDKYILDVGRPVKRWDCVQRDENILYDNDMVNAVC